MPYDYRATIERLWLTTMKFTQEMVLTPNTQNESDFNEDDLRKRYMIEDGENNA